MAKRRQRRRCNHEGCIFQRSNGTWYASVTIMNSDGTKSRKTRKAETQEHAGQLVAELKAEFGGPGRKQSVQVTVEDLVGRWYQSVKADESTKDGYNRAIQKRIVPFIGDVKCNQLSMMGVEDWLLSLPEDLGQRSKQMAFEVLTYAFNYGTKRQIVPFNPCDSELRPEVTQEEINPFSDEEIAKIFRHIEGHRLESLHHIAIGIGARQGELFGLQWRDIDWGNGTIRIERQAKEYKGRIIIKVPKTKSSKRTVKLPQAILEKLRGRRKIAFSERRAQPGDFVFTSQRGCVIRRTNFSRRLWASILKETCIPPRGYHHTRHTAATKMLRLGTPVHVVARILGHASPATTLRIYSHYIPADGEVASSKMSEELRRLGS